MVVLQRLPHVWHLFRTETNLASLAAGIADVEDPEGMALAASAFGAATGMLDGTLKEGAAEDVTEAGEAGSQTVSLADGLLSCHQY